MHPFAGADKIVPDVNTLPANPSSTRPASWPAAWRLADPDPELVRSLAQNLGMAPTVARLLIQRGLGDAESARAHLAKSAHDLHDPDLLPGVPAACERLAKALRDGETILVHGDYDVDGVTGTALLVRCLRMLAARSDLGPKSSRVEWHIPNRLTDGYSFGAHSLERARSVGATLGISVDNGTSAHETIADLLEAGIDTIVTDHHEPPKPHPKYGPLPPAVAIVNPKLAESTYPWRELCGGAVAFKLAWGLCKHLAEGDRVGPTEKRFLEESLAYVAIATVCDVVPLRDENRLLVEWGLKSLRAGFTPGLRALVEVAGLGGREIRAEDVAFQIGPRINASGRLGSAEVAVECLLAEDDETAGRLAASLEQKNQLRREIERNVHEQARRAAEPFADRDQHPVLVLGGEGWHQGVVGIVAARLVEEYERPAVVVGFQDGEGRGSARSVPGFSVLEALHGGAEFMERYGGHEQAAGMELRESQLGALREAVCGRAKTLFQEGEAPEPALDIDAELCLSLLDPSLMRQIDRLEPFGSGNATPVFLARDARLAEPPRRIGADRSHLLFQARRGASRFKVLAFGKGHRADELRMGQPLDLVYTPRWNTFRGETNLELIAKDFVHP